MGNMIATVANHVSKKARSMRKIFSRHSGLLLLCALAVATFFAPKVLAATFNVYEGINQYQKAIGEAAVNGSQSSVAHDIGGTVSDGADTKPVLGGVEGILYWAVSSLGTGGKQIIASRGPNGEMISKTVTFPGAIGSTINLTAMVYQNPVASSTEFIADLRENIGAPFGVQKAYAQGLGFSSLRPVLELWRLFRNLAYFFFVVIFIIIGFLIMFRSKIGGQTAVTVQQALPKIVISLILVTFSYAIAGLMIDIMYLLMYLIIGVFQGVFPGGSIDVGGGTSQPLTEVAFRNDIFTNGIRLTSVAGDIASSMGTIVNNILNNLGWSTATAGIVSFGAGVIFLLILIVAIIISLFRVFFALLQAYISIFFLVIFGPIQLLIGALPGQNTFGSWIKGLVENLLVFPTLVLLIFIAYFFSKGTNVNGQAYTAPGLGNDGVTSEGTSLSEAVNPLGDVTGTANAQGFSAPQLGSNQQGGFAVYQSLLALGAILAMPEILKVTKGLMSGKLDVSPKNLMENVKTATQASLPLAGATVGGVGSGVRNIYRGRREGTVNSLVDARQAFRQGVKPGARAGLKSAARVGRFVDNILEGRIYNPSDTSGLLEKMVEGQEQAKKEKAEAEKNANQVQDPT